MIGRTLGPYEIVSALGAGGMGEVYRARDTKLGRNVAIKVLPDAFAQDPERVARFQREAQLLAALNHANIAAIYGLEESESARFLVLELVEGESLAGRLQRGNIDLEEALTIARQLVDALEAAHDKGIIHRDLKPSNIMLTSDGQVKVLDFGLAKALGPAAGPPEGGHYDPSAAAGLSNSPTLTIGGTQVGMILGTAAYMAPEQAKGRPADKRSDIWALGCVLYEMLTGRRAFSGEDVSDTLAAVLRGEPDWSAVPSATPDNVRTLIKRCLEKDRKKRIGDVSTVRYVLDESAAPGVPAPSPAPSASRSLTIGAIVAAAVVAAIVTWALTRPAPAASSSPVRFSVAAPADVFFPTPSPFNDIAITADGTRLVYLTGATPTAGAMWVRPLHQLDAVQVRGITDTQGGPFISPDGAWIGFASQRDPTRMELIKIAMSGGPPVPICRVDGQLRGASWGADGTIVFATSDPNTGLFSVPANGGEPNALTKPDPQQGELDHTLPFFLPGRRVILFTITAMGGLDSSQIAALDLESGDRKIVLRGATHAQYVDVPTGSGQGHLLYAAAGGLRAVRFDPARLEVVGESVPIVETVLTKSSGAAQFTVSENGTLVFIQGTSQATGAGPASPRSLVWVTRQGREEPIKAPPRPYATPRLSPDGQKIALGIRDQRNDIWTLDLTNGALTPVTLDPAADYAPVWTLDGKRLIFSSERAGPPNLYWQASDGTGRAERLTTSSNFQSGLSLVPDGSGVLVKESVQALPANLTLLRLDKPSETPGLGNLHTEPLLQENRTEDNAVVSSDGGWIAYESDESGQYEVYVRPFPNVDSGRTQVSVNGGTKPLWAPSGRELFYIDAGGFLTVVPVQTSPTFSRGNPVQVLSTRYYLSGARTFDVTRDGQKFLMIKEMPGAGQPGAGQIAASSATTMTVVLSWFEELKAKAGAR